MEATQYYTACSFFLDFAEPSDDDFLFSLPPPPIETPTTIEDPSLINHEGPPLPSDDENSWMEDEEEVVLPSIGMSPTQSQPPYPHTQNYVITITMNGDGMQ